MAGNENQKLKLLYLMKILLEQTDEEHILPMSEIIAELSKYGISAERKSMYKDIELLTAFGIEVMQMRTKTVGYYIGAREFELPELKLLVDAVQCSKFITKKKSNELIKKLENLTSKHYAKQLQRQVFVSDRVKTLNERIYYNIDKLHVALTDNKKVSFKYYEYTVEKKKQYRNDGAEYIISPYALSWADDNYYVISYYAKYQGELTHFRVDRMTDITVLEQDRESIKAVTGEQDFNIANYSKGIFSMFSGEKEKVKLEFSNDLINVAIDRFGEDIPIHKTDDGHFNIMVEVSATQTFYAWLFQFGDKVKILSPDNVQGKMREMAERVCRLYNKN